MYLFLLDNKRILLLLCAAFFSPNGIRKNSHNPNGVEIAVLELSQEPLGSGDTRESSQFWRRCEIVLNEN